MKYFWKFIKPYTKEIVLLMFLFAVRSLATLFMPFVMSDIVELGIRNQDLDYVVKQGAVIFALAVAAFICALVTNKVSSNFSSKIAVNMRREVFNKVNRLTFEQFSEIGTGSLLTRTTDDIGWMEETISQVPYVIISCPILFIGGIALSFRGDWVLPLILLGVSVLVLVITTLICSTLEKHWQRGDEYTDVQNRIIRERLSGIRVVRAFDKESHEHERAKRATSEMCNSFVKANTISGIISPLASLFLNAATVVIIYVGAIRLQSVETLKAGNILATIQYVALIANAVMILSWTISFVPHVKVSLRRISAILDAPTQTEQSSGEVLIGSVKFDNVDFAYDNAAANALTDVSLDIQNGEIVGIIGGTGSGKSTLVKLILDFYSAIGGKRYIGGRDYAELSPATVRDNVAVALQKSMIFEGTVKENVKMGNRDATDEQVLQALAIAQMTDFVQSREEGLDYKLTQAGNNVSGGQKQRINIARTILKPAQIYIFDDSFSALDYLTEANLRKQLNKYLEGKTQIIVTQRAATAMRCDKVYVLDCGKVVGFGTHKQLLKECKTYKEIYDSQMGGGANE
ncbi:MAG: ABC transporter ATP-binding protein/permease [Corallococcus sp.]|nr:ABC transporter ATP-binding protein/permease [Corallococcus sp.]MCM1359040.1 ABC transporter ATP-binding protein/permease [Corallococcus sp.]MCM1395029.1 ABC transporter ATP-binding protein/permease [Corallococcus sp.]